MLTREPWIDVPSSSNTGVSHDIKRHLFIGGKAMINLDSVLKSRDITLPTEVHILKAVVFPGVMYGCQSWTINKAEHQKTDAFELCWRRLLRVPWTARRSNQSFLKEINPLYSLEGLMLKLKLQYFGHLMRRADSLEKNLILGKIEGRRRRGWQRMRWLNGITDLMDMVWVNSGSWWWTGRPGVLQFMGSQGVGHDWTTKLNWTELPNGGASLVTQMVKTAYQCRRRGFDPWLGKIPCRRKWQPTLVFLPGKSHGQRSLVGYSPWGLKESDTTEWLNGNSSLTDAPPFNLRCQTK